MAEGDLLDALDAMNQRLTTIVGRVRDGGGRQTDAKNVADLCSLSVIPVN